MDEMEDLLVDAKAKKRSILAEKVSGENIYKALIFFDKLYEKMSETERRQFYEKLLGEVNIYEERQLNGHWIKSVVFKLPIIEHDMELSLDNDDSVETVVCLGKNFSKPKDYIQIGIDAEDYYRIVESEKKSG